METGVTEAKLIEKKEKPVDNALIASQSRDDKSEEEDFGLSPSELKKALKNIKNEAKEEKIKNKYRSYDQLQMDFEELNIRPKSDAEIIKELIEKHLDIMNRKDIDEDEVLTILEDLEYLVHQYDNANEFISLNGLKNIVYKNLNSTNDEIKRESLKLLGASIQNNPMVKIRALDSGCIDILLRMIVLENDSSVKYRALFALGSLLRSFPFAQLKFIENAGLSVFFKLFELENLKIQLKTLTIINDLLQEEVDAQKDDNPEKIKQYKNIKFRKHLLQNNYCEILNKFLLNSVIIESNDHDIIEKGLVALYTVVDDCSLHLTLKSKEILLNLRNLYKTLSDTEKKQETNEDMYYYYTSLYDLSNNIVKKISRNKDEF